jgi:ribonuclease HII
MLTQNIPGLKDSKKLTPNQRLGLAEKIVKSSILSLAIGSNFEIDRINILNSTIDAMKRSVIALSRKCQIESVLIDGNKVPAGLPWNVLAIVNGDDSIPQIMAASIVAKVSRDHIMKGYGNSLPGYGFEIHMGYGTKDHYASLNLLGPCRIHRRSYRLC